MSDGTSTNANAARKRVPLASPVSHSDWMWDCHPELAWGPEGVRQILDRCKDVGFERVYWRCFDGGRAVYPSQIMEPSHYIDQENYHSDRGTFDLIRRLEQWDFGSFDILGEAIAYGHSIGVEVHAWLSINEDDHGYGWTSRYTREHPESRWVCRDGRVFHSQQSFAFPEVRAYKLDLVKEILEYGPDGFFFDWIRAGDIRDDPHTDDNGVAIYGYETPNIERFRELYGQDPHEVPNDDERWVRVRVEPQTVFAREAHALIKGANPDLPISAMVTHPWGYRNGQQTPTSEWKQYPYADNLRGLLLDLRTWAREGLIDEAVAAGYYREGGAPEAAYKYLEEETENRVALWLYGWINYGSTDSVSRFARESQLAERLGPRQLLLWESHQLRLAPEKADMVQAMREFAGR